MSRTSHAFRAVENRIDRGRTAERRHALALTFSSLARTTADGVLGGYAPDQQEALIDALIREFCARRKAVSDGPAVGGLLGEIASKLCADIEGPRDTAKRCAEIFFQGGDA